MLSRSSDCAIPTRRHTTPPTRTITVHGLAPGLLLPILAFGLLQLPPDTRDSTAVSPLPDGDADCPTARVTVPPMCSSQPLSSGEGVPMYNCDPGGSDDALWSATVRFTGLGPQGSCDYRPQILDSRNLGSTLSPIVASPSGPVPAWRARRIGDAWEVDLPIPPWRAQAVILTRRAPRDPGARALASPPVRLRGMREHGVSVRDSALWSFALQGAVGLLAMLLMFRFRPGARDLGGGARRMPRWQRVAAISGAGGVVMAVLAGIRPADVGGFDVFDPWRILIHLPLGVAAAAFMGCWLDLCRRGYLSSSGAARVVALMLGAAVVVLVLPRIYLATSAWTLPGRAIGYGYKTRYYAYFGLAALVPMITVRAVSPFMLRGRGSAEPPAGRQAMLLFAIALSGCVVANLLAIGLAPWLQPEAMPARFCAFFKPASAWGLLVVAAPAVLGIALGVAHGEERSAWLQELDATLSAALDAPDPADRVALSRALILLLCRQQISNPTALTSLALATMRPHIGWLIAGFCQTDADREQLAAALDRPSDSLAEVIAQLETALASAGPLRLPRTRVELTDAAIARVDVRILIERGLGADEIRHALVIDGRLVDAAAMPDVSAGLRDALSLLRPQDRRLTSGRRVLVELATRSPRLWSASVPGLPEAVRRAVLSALGLSDARDSAGSPSVYTEPSDKVTPRETRNETRFAPGHPVEVTVGEDILDLADPSTPLEVDDWHS
jgi:hypothetical protein